MKGLIKIIDKLTEIVGKAVSVLVFVLLIVVVYEVISRKIFNSPTVWAFELSYMLYGTLFMLGLGYALKHGSHVCIDVISNRFSPKKQAILSIFSYIVFFFPFMYFGIKSSWQFFSQSWAMRELSQSPWSPPIYPFKFIMLLGFLLLTIQGISEFFKQIYKFKGE